MMKGISSIRQHYYGLVTYVRARRFAAGVERSLLAGDSCLLIYQMGRVASQTLNDTAAACLPDVPVYHVHWLNEANLKEAERRARNRYGFVRQRHLMVSRRLRRFMDMHGLEGREWLVVTVVRDPVARSLSEYFLTLEEYHVRDAFQIFEKDPTQVEQWATHFSENYDHLSRCHWFEEEIGEVLGVNVFSKPFDHNNGYLLVEEGTVKVLVLRQEDLEKGVRHGFMALTGVRPREITSRHVSRHDPHAEIYRLLQQHVRLREDLLEEIYACPWVRHFYTEEEIDGWRRRWSGMV